MRAYVLPLLLFCCSAASVSAQSFTIDVDPPSRTTIGATTTWTVKVTPGAGFSAPLFFRARGLDGVSVNAVFAPEVLRAPYDQGVTVTLTCGGIKEGVTAGIEIEGYNGLLSARDTVMITLPGKAVWRTFTTENSGLPSPMITRGLVLDSSGNGWFTADQGVVRFDGTTWTTFRDIGEITAVVQPLAADAGGVWFTTMLPNFSGGGLAYFDGATWRIFDSSTGYSDSLAGGVTSAAYPVAATTHGGLWARTNNGLVHYDGTRMSFLPFPMRTGSGMAVGRSGRIWVTGALDAAPYYELLGFDGTIWNEYSVAEAGIPTTKYTIPWAVDPDDRLWLLSGDPNTLFVFDPATKKTTEFMNDDGSGTVRQGVNCIRWTAAGNLWIGHGGSRIFENRTVPDGVHRWDGTRWWHYTKENSGLVDNNVYDIQIDEKNNRIWILSRTGLSILDGNAPPDSTVVAGVRAPATPGHGERRLASAYPNPTTGAATIDLALDGPSRVSISVTSLLGRVVAEASERTLDAGARRITLDLSTVEPGTYLVRALVGDRVESIPITVVR